MILGFPTHPRKNLIEEIDWIAANGFDFVDLFIEDDQASPEHVNVTAISAILRRYGLGVVGHTAWYLPIGSPNKNLRLAAVQEASRSFGVFRDIGVKLVTIHADWPSSMFSIDEGVSFQTKSLRQLVEEAGKNDLEIVYELSVSRENTVENIDKVLSGVPGLGFHLDIGHANLNGNKPERFIEKLHSRLRHVHLSDNNGYEDLHLPVGCGNINWEKTLKKLKEHYDETITLEIFSNEKHYAQLSKQRVNELWSRL